MFTVVHRDGNRRNEFYQNQQDGHVYCYLVLDGHDRHEQYRSRFPDLNNPDKWTPIDEPPEWYNP
jgi:hypothetical protein